MYPLDAILGRYIHMGKNADAVLSQFTQAEEEKKVDTSRKLKVGIIGTGWIAEAHIQSYKNMPDVDVVAAADLIPGKAAAFFKKHGIEGVSVDHVSVSEISMVPVDLYVVGSDLAPFLKDKPRVIELDNIVSMSELEEKLLAAFEKARNE